MDWPDPGVKNNGRRWFCAFIAALAGWSRATSTGVGAEGDLHPPLVINFTLSQPGFVTLVVEDADGKRVRNLISETPFPAGKNTAWWDGLDDLGRNSKAARRGVYDVPGKLVRPGLYRVRGLVRPQLKARWLMAPYFGAANPPWANGDRSSEWLANHSPPSAV